MWVRMDESLKGRRSHKGASAPTPVLTTLSATSVGNVSNVATREKFQSSNHRAPESNKASGKVSNIFTPSLH